MKKKNISLFLRYSLVVVVTRLMEVRLRNFFSIRDVGLEISFLLGIWTGPGDYLA